MITKKNINEAQKILKNKLSIKFYRRYLLLSIFFVLLSGCVNFHEPSRINIRLEGSLDSGVIFHLSTDDGETIAVEDLLIDSFNVRRSKPSGNVWTISSNIQNGGGIHAKEIVYGESYSSLELLVPPQKLEKLVWYAVNIDAYTPLNQLIRGYAEFFIDESGKIAHVY